MKTTLKLLAIALVANLNAQIIPSAEQTQQQQQAFYRDATAVVKQNINPQTGVPYLATGINLSMVDSFANLYQFNDADYNTADAALFLQAMSELYQASSQSQFLSASALEAKRNPQMIMQNISARTTTLNTVQIGIINTDFDFLFYDSENESNGGLTFQNGLFQPIAGKPSAFIKHLVMIAPQKSSVSAEGGVVSFQINPDIYFNKGKKITNLTANFGDGINQNLITNGSVNTAVFSVNYSNPGEKVIPFNITYEDGSTFTTYGSILVTFPQSTYTTYAATSCTVKTNVIPYTSKIPYQAWGETAPKYGKMEYKIFYANDNQTGVCGMDRVKKPFIVIDGFDPGDKRRIEAIDCDENCKKLLDEDTRNNFGSKYKSIYDLMSYKIDPNNPNETPQKLTDILTQKGYDVIIINLPTERDPNNFDKIIQDYGADFIERNAMSFVSFLQDVNASMHSRGITEKAVVVGPSMGGQITRYALAYMEKKQQETGDTYWDHNAKLWISMDSPHQGANISLALQGSIAFLGYNRGMEEAKGNYEKQLMTPAARQMLIEHAEEKLYGQNGGISPYYTSYQQNLHNNGLQGSNGYPLNLKKIAIVNGSITGTKNLTPTQTILDMRGYIDLSWAFFHWTINTFRSTQLAQPEYQQSNLLYHIGSAKLGLPVWGSLELSRPNGFSKGSLDAVPGGYYNAINDFKVQSAQTLRKMKQRRRYYIPNAEETPTNPQSFISTHSALDTSGFSDWYQPINKNLVCTGQTPFDSYYGEDKNMDHISFTPNMVAWLIGWLDGNEIPPPAIGSENLLINGNTLLCNNDTSIYNLNVCGLSTAINWNIENGSIISQNSNSITVKATNNGLMKITASFPNSSIAPLVKKVWVGKPSVYYELNPNGNYVYYTLKSTNPEVTLQEQGITSITCATISNTGGSISSNCDSGLAHGPSYNWYIERKILATNNCGTYETIQGITPPAPDPCDGYRIVKTNNSKNNYRIIDPCSGSNRTMDDQKFRNIKTQIADTKGNIAFETTDSEFDVSRLLTGVYYVRIIKNNNIVHNQTIIKE